MRILAEVGKKLMLLRKITGENLLNREN